MVDEDKLNTARKTLFRGKEFGLGKRVVEKAADTLKDKYGLAIIDQARQVHTAVNSKMQAKGEYNPVTNSITFKDASSTFDGNTVGEEYGHFLRTQYKAQTTGKPIDFNGEKHVSEFFGYLSRRLLYEAGQQQDKDLFFPKGVDPPGQRSKVMELLKGIRKIKQEVLAKGGEHKDEALEQLDGIRKNNLVHHRPYEYASKVDISRIKDWQKLYALPDYEVRKRFFTNKQDYSGLDSGVRDITSKLLVTSAFLFFSLSLFSISKFTLIGNVIWRSEQTTNILSIVFFILGIISLYFCHKVK